jgi:hypothetical protein
LSQTPDPLSVSFANIGKEKEKENIKEKEKEKN